MGFEPSTLEMYSCIFSHQIALPLLKLSGNLERLFWLLEDTMFFPLMPGKYIERLKY